MSWEELQEAHMYLSHLTYHKVTCSNVNQTFITVFTLAFEWSWSWNKTLQSTTSHSAYPSSYYTITYTSFFKEVLGNSHCSQKLPCRKHRHRTCNSHQFWQTEQHRKSETALLHDCAANQPNNQRTKELSEGVDLRLYSSWFPSICFDIPAFDRIAGVSNRHLKL